MEIVESSSDRVLIRKSMHGSDVIVEITETIDGIIVKNNTPDGCEYEDKETRGRFLFSNARGIFSWNKFRLMITDRTAR